MRSTSLGVAEAGNLKLDLMAKKHWNSFFDLNTFLDVMEIPKPQKPCWSYRHFNSGAPRSQAELHCQIGKKRKPLN